MGVDIDGSEAPEPTINWLHFQILLGFFFFLSFAVLWKGFTLIRMSVFVVIL